MKGEGGGRIQAAMEAEVFGCVGSPHTHTRPIPSDWVCGESACSLPDQCLQPDPLLYLGCPLTGSGPRSQPSDPVLDLNPLIRS